MRFFRKSRGAQLLHLTCDVSSLGQLGVAFPLVHRRQLWDLCFGQSQRDPGILGLWGGGSFQERSELVMCQTPRARHGRRICSMNVPVIHCYDMRHNKQPHSLRSISMLINFPCSHVSWIVLLIWARRGRSQLGLLMQAGELARGWLA